MLGKARISPIFDPFNPPFLYIEYHNEKDGKQTGAGWAGY
jgi:hypothetical protein